MSKPASGNSPARVLSASLIGTAIEFFDFYIYATAAVLVFPKLFFADPSTALLASMANALGGALGPEKDRLAAAGTLAVTASGVTFLGVGSAFWGLVFGLLMLALESARSNLRAAGRGRGTGS